MKGLHIIRVIKYILIGFGISIYQGSFGQESIILIRNGIMIDGTGSGTRICDILIENDRIVNIGKELKPTRVTKLIDATGKTVLPGLIDMHGHLYALGATQLEAYPTLYLAGGVTTIFSPGEFEPEKIYSLKERIQSEEVIGPDILFTGPYFESINQSIPWMKGTDDPIKQMQLFEDWKDRIDGIKIYSHVSKDYFDRIINRAKENNLMVTGHLGTIDTRYAVDHGINGLEHGLLAIKDFGGDPNDYKLQMEHISKLDLTSKEVTDLVDAIVANNVYVDPTMVLIESFSNKFKPIVDSLEYFVNESAWSWVSRHIFYPDEIVNPTLSKQMEFSRLVYERKGILVTGTDPVSPRILPGFGIKREMELFYRCGIPIDQVVRIASLNGAIALGKRNNIGSIEIGKKANLLILDGDLLKDINCLYKTELVLKNGKIYDPKLLLKKIKGKGKVQLGDWSEK